MHAQDFNVRQSLILQLLVLNMATQLLQGRCKTIIHMKRLNNLVLATVQCVVLLVILGKAAGVGLYSSTQLELGQDTTQSLQISIHLRL